jgi:thymidylate synthase (FAD)
MDHRIYLGGHVVPPREVEGKQAMRRVKPSVRLIAGTVMDDDNVYEYLEDEVGAGDFITNRPDMVGPTDLVEFAGRVCYRSWQPGLNPNVLRVRIDQTEYVDNILESKHGSVLEHSSFTLLFSNVSRVFTHELVRHRAGMAYSQESMRFVRLDDLGMWFPTWALGDDELISRCESVLYILEQHQQWMARHFRLDDEGVPFSEKKTKTSFMRRFAPEGVATTIVATGNVRAWRHLIAARTSLGAEEEIRYMFREAFVILKGEVPLLFSDASLDAETGVVTFANEKV